MEQFLFGVIVGMLVAGPVGMYLLRQTCRRIAREEGAGAVLHALGIDD